jgi:hypothetical protein
MGISLEEYLRNRESCSVCDTNGNTDHCRTTMLSRVDNCLIYNSILFNDDPYDDGDVILLQNLRNALKEEKILEYYIRSERLVKHAKYVFDQAFWPVLYKKFVGQIVSNLKASDTESAISNIYKMLDSLEQDFQL